jgi:hypothetical protein
VECFISCRLVFCLTTLILVSSVALFPLNHASAQTVIGYDYSPWFEASGENYVDIPDAADLRLAKFSVAAWFKTSANYYVNGMIVNKGGPGNETSGNNVNYGIWLTSQERLRAGFESADGTDYYVTHKNTYSDGQWHYVVLTYDGSALRLYLDGTQLGWRAISATPETSGTMPLRIGANSQAKSGYFMGQLDEVRVWNRAVPETEVLSQYQLGIFNTDGMLSYFNGDMPDVHPPALIAPPDQLVISTGNLTSLALGMPIIADERDSSPTIANNAPDVGFPVGTSTVTWTVTDDSGNTAIADQSITVIEPVSPSGPVHTFCTSGCDYNNLQSAINSLPDIGGTVFIAGGNKYVISNTITLKSGTMIEFDDQASIYFRGNAVPLFNGTGISNVKIIGGEITVENSGVKALSFTSTSGITVTGTKITMVKGGNSSPFYCVDCMGVYISKIHASSASRLIEIISSSRTAQDGKSAEIWIQDSVFDDASIEGVKVNHSNDVHIINNTVSNTGDNGIDIGWNVNSDVAYNRLTRTGYPNGGAIGSDSSNGGDIMNNYINATGRNGIQVYRAYNINVGGNTIIDAGAQGVSVITQGEPSANIKIISNHIISPAGFGIYESRSQVEVEIGNNVIEEMPDGVQAINIVRPNGTTRLYGNVVN